MRDRRSVLLGGAALLALPALAAASPHRHGHAHAAKGGSGGDGDDEGDATMPADASPAQTPIGPLDVQSRWAIIIDANTNAVLLSKNADEAMPPSSLTKLMTAFVVFGMLKKGRITLGQTMPVSEKAWRMQGSKMFVPLGGQVSVAELIRGMIIQSGNDACIVLAEGIAGSEDQFVELMNQAAARLGMTNSKFENATGWPSPGHVMSVRDIATVALAIVRDYPEYYHFFGEKSYTFNGIDQGNRNVLVDRGLADGLKTGHTEAGGFGICASADRAGRRIMMVLNGMPSSHVRIEESARLLSWAFGSFEDVTLFAAGAPVGTAPVWLGEAHEVALVSPTDVVFTMPHGWRRSAKVSIDYQAPVTAPIAKGQPVGTLVVSGDGVPNARLPLVAGSHVGRMALPLRSLAVLEHMVTGS